MTLDLPHLSPSLLSGSLSPLQGSRFRGADPPAGLLVLRKLPTLPDSVAVAPSHIWSFP